MPEWLKCGELGVPFVNVEVGGTLTSSAAPPVLMVADAWNWDSTYMAANFGWKAALAVLVNATGMTLLLRKRVRDGGALPEPALPTHWLVGAIHLIFLAAAICWSRAPWPQGA